MPAPPCRGKQQLLSLNGGAFPAPPDGRGELAFYPVGFAVDQRPAFDRTPVAGFPVGELGFHDEPGIDDEVQRGFILKADVNRMVLAGGEDLYKIDEFVFDFFIAVERASAVTADCGLAAFGLC